MPSLWHILLCAALTGMVWTVLGLGLARQVGLGLACAPALGWAAFNAAALPLLLLLGLTRGTAALACAAAVVLGALLWRRAPPARAAAAPPWWSYAAAALVALGPAAAILPKLGADGVQLSPAMYDHAKVALIDAMTRLGLPPVNPFFGADAAGGRLAYYYLWHFGAAVPAKLLGISGWEADIALTGLTAWASLTLMMGLAVALSGRRGAALWVLPLSLAGALAPLLRAALGKAAFFGLFAQYQAPQVWLIQASWVPQHLAAASSALLAAALIARLAAEPRPAPAVALALAAAAGFESSAWIGGITFAAAAVPLGLAMLALADPRQRRRFALAGAGAAVLALLLAAPVLRDEAAATAAREVGVPIALHPYEVLGPAVPDALRRALDLPAFWLLLVIALPAISFAGALSLWRLLRTREAPEPLLATALAVLAAAGLVITWLFASTIANNDLGWRAVLPAVLALTASAAAGMARWLAPSARRAALALLLLGLPGGALLLHENLAGVPAPSDPAFAGTVALWQAVRAASAPDERVADNPSFLGDIAVWPSNLSWALLSDRSSCFAGWDLARPYAALTAPEIDALDRLFKRAFAGDASAEELRTLATRYRCRVIVLTPGDGAWQHDGFAASGAWRLAAERADAWRIYRALP